VPFQVNNDIKDPAGRFVIIQGRLVTEIINLVNIYGPIRMTLNFIATYF